MSSSKTLELSSSSSLAEGISADSIHVSKTTANNLDKDQYAINQTVVSDTVPKNPQIRLRFNCWLSK